MKPYLHNATAFLLATIYVAVAAFGNALHDHHSSGCCPGHDHVAQPGQEGHGAQPGSEIACGGDCVADLFDCGSCPSPAGKKPAGGSEPVAQTPAHGHDADDCGVCSLFGQLKLGHSIAHSVVLTTAETRDTVAPVDSPAAGDGLLFFDARGPPARDLG